MNHKSKTSIDGTDFHIVEQTLFHGMYYSHIFKGPGLRYEVGIYILTGRIVWIIGGYPCGAYLDLHIVREVLSEILEIGEKVITDCGYKGEDQIYTKGHCREAHLIDVRTRHEKVNIHLKNVSCCQQFLGMIYAFIFNASMRLRS